MTYKDTPRVLLATLALVLAASIVSAMPSFSMSGGASSHCCGNVAVEVNSGAHNIHRSINMSGNFAVRMPVRFHHVRVREIMGDGNRMRVVMDNNREVNIMGPVAAITHIQRMLQRHFNATPAELNTIIQNTALTECEKLNSQTLNEEYVPCYVAPVKVRARLLGIFPVTVTETAQCDAVTGNCTVSRPWWAFLLFSARLQA